MFPFSHTGPRLFSRIVAIHSFANKYRVHNFSVEFVWRNFSHFETKINAKII